jgi:hypothetical protein
VRLIVTDGGRFERVDADVPRATSVRDIPHRGRGRAARGAVHARRAARPAGGEPSVLPRARARRRRGRPVGRATYWRPAALPRARGSSRRAVDAHARAALLHRVRMVRLPAVRRAAPGAPAASDRERRRNPVLRPWGLSRRTQGRRPAGRPPDSGRPRPPHHATTRPAETPRGNDRPSSPGPAARTSNELLRQPGRRPAELRAPRRHRLTPAP